MFFFSKSPGDHAISSQNLESGLPYLLIELFYIGIPVLRTDTGDGRTTVTWLPEFLGCIDKQIFLLMVLVWELRYEITLKKRFLRELKKTNFKSFKFYKMKSYAWWFYLLFRNSCEFWNLFSRAPIGTFSLALFHITYYIYSSWKV